MNAARVKFIHSCIGNHKKVGKQLSGLRILDVGCGGGLLAESLSRLGAEVTAIDPSKENITVASEHSSVDPLTATITYRQTTIEDVCAAGEKFDAVTCLEVIEHVDSPLRFMQNVCGVLDTGGSAFFSTMNRNPKSYALTIVAAEYILGMLPPGTHEWNKYITPEEMKVMLNSSGVDMTPSNWRGLVFNVHPIRGIEWSLSESDLEVNYIMHAKKR
jgi:ubiquinone biosynthesis O-methyltransferase